MILFIEKIIGKKKNDLALLPKMKLRKHIFLCLLMNFVFSFTLFCSTESIPGDVYHSKSVVLKPGNSDHDHGHHNPFPPGNAAEKRTSEAEGEDNEDDENKTKIGVNLITLFVGYTLFSDALEFSHFSTDFFNSSKTLLVISNKSGTFLSVRNIRV